jgi:hypothetical protein
VTLARYQFIYKTFRMCQYWEDMSKTPDYSASNRDARSSIKSASTAVNYDYLRGFVDGMWNHYGDEIIKVRPYLKEQK